MTNDDLIDLLNSQATERAANIPLAHLLRMAAERLARLDNLAQTCAAGNTDAEDLADVAITVLGGMA